jgi:CubicO group peptidase (beta-lactamase class C family)
MKNYSLHRSQSMKKFGRFLVLFVLFLNLIYCHQTVETDAIGPEFLGKGNYLGEYWPTSGWRTCRPEEVGLSSDKLIEVYEYAANPHIRTQGIAIIRKGYIVGEGYFRGFTSRSRHESFSVAKSFSSALIGIAIDKDMIDNIDEKVSEFYPEWKRPGTQEEKKRMTIKHLLTMTSGLQWNEEDYYRDRSQNDVYIMIGSVRDYIQYVLNKPTIHEPGQHWYYSSGDTTLLSGIIEKSTGMKAYDFALENLFEPMGLSDIIWLADPAGHTITAWGIQGTVREFAKFGYLYLKKGRWENQQLVPVNWVEESLQPISENVEKYGYQWWLLPALRGYKEANIPAKTFLAWGIFTQQIFVIPEKELVIVRLGNDRNPAQDEWREVEFLSLVLESFQE